MRSPTNSSGLQRRSSWTPHRTQKPIVVKDANLGDYVPVYYNLQPNDDLYLQVKAVWEKLPKKRVTSSAALRRACADAGHDIANAKHFGHVLHRDSEKEAIWIDSPSVGVHCVFAPVKQVNGLRPAYELIEADDQVAVFFVAS